MFDLKKKLRPLTNCWFWYIPVLGLVTFSAYKFGIGTGIRLVDKKSIEITVPVPVINNLKHTDTVCIEFSS